MKHDFLQITRTDGLHQLADAWSVPLLCTVGQVLIYRYAIPRPVAYRIPRRAISQFHLHQDKGRMLRSHDAACGKAIVSPPHKHGRGRDLSHKLAKHLHGVVFLAKYCIPHMAKLRKRRKSRKQLCATCRIGGMNLQYEGMSSS